MRSSSVALNGSLCMSVFLSICLLSYLAICLSSCLSTCLASSPSTYRSVYSYIYKFYCYNLYSSIRSASLLPSILLPSRSFHPSFLYQPSISYLLSLFPLCIPSLLSFFLSSFLPIYLPYILLACLPSLFPNFLPSIFSSYLRSK